MNVEMQWGSGNKGFYLVNYLLQTGATGTQVKSCWVCLEDQLTFEPQMFLQHNHVRVSCDIFQSVYVGKSV